MEPKSNVGCQKALGQISGIGINKSQGGNVAEVGSSIAVRNPGAAPRLLVRVGAVSSGRDMVVAQTGGRNRRDMVVGDGTGNQRH